MRMHLSIASQFSSASLFPSILIGVVRAICSMHTCAVYLTTSYLFSLTEIKMIIHSYWMGVKLSLQISMSAYTRDVCELFSGKIFKVPNYQRIYSWDNKQWEDFWNDIKEGLSTNTQHYWGTITLKRTDELVDCKEKDLSFRIYEIVDGQQRVTTLYLFLLALSHVRKTMAIVDNFIKCGNIYRLELGSLNNQFLKGLVDNKNPQPDIKTNKLLKGALEYFENQIGSYGNLDTLSRYVQRITFSLEFSVLDDKLAVRAFQSLNDRGKSLTLLDKTKSFLMFYSMRYLNNNLNNLIDTVFGHLFLHFDRVKDTGEKEGIDYIRSKDRFTEDEALRLFYHYFAYYAIKKYSLPHDVSYDYDISAENVFELFLKKSCIYLKSDEKTLQKFIEDFLGSFDRFMESFKNIIHRTQTSCVYRKMFCSLGLNVRVYPLIISLEAENILDKQLLEIIETLDLRVYKVRGTQPRAQLYRDVISQIKRNPSANQIHNNVRNFVDNFMSDSEFQFSLDGIMYYNPATKYILWEFEKHKNSSFDDCNYDLYKKVEREHVFSRNISFKFPAHGFSDEADYINNINRLGNLILLERNINRSIARLQPPVPSNKASHYQKSQLSEPKRIGSQISNYGFKKGDIDTRTREIAEFCKQRWRI